MRLYLVLFPPSIRKNRSEKSLFVSGEDQWEMAGSLKGKLRILMSYHYFKDTDIEEIIGQYFGSEENWPEIFADCGAFSAMTIGADLLIDDYIEWIKRWEKYFFTYANLDVHADQSLTESHHRSMLDAGLNPLPVFHAGFDYRMLISLCEEYNYVALGGIAGEQFSASRHMMAWFAKVFEIAADQTVFHCFGVTGWKLLSTFPYFSVDGSSWAMGFMYGAINLFWPARGRFYKIRLGNSREIYRVAPLFKHYGFDPEDFAVRERNDRMKIATISALSWMEAEKYLRIRHGEIRIPDREVRGPALRHRYPDEAGPRMYLSNADNLSDYQGVGDENNS